MSNQSDYETVDHVSQVCLYCEIILALENTPRYTRRAKLLNRAHHKNILKCTYPCSPLPFSPSPVKKHQTAPFL